MEDLTDSDYEYVGPKYFDDIEPAPVRKAKPYSKPFKYQPLTSSKKLLSADDSNLATPLTHRRYALNASSRSAESFVDKYKCIQEIDLFIDAINNRKKG
jgi:hypothetical protein